MSAFKDFARKWAERLPFSLTKNIEYDRQTLKVMKKVLKPDSNCLDIGCHKGEVLEHMLHFAPNGKHVGFEPLPDFFEKLESHFPQNCQFFNMALSDKKGEVTFHHVVSNPAYSGIKKRSYAREDEEVQKITVATDRLDDVLKPIGQKVDFIKIDVEGAELQVLKGATETLKEHKPIVVFEHGLGAADHYNTTPEEVFELLTSCNLRLDTMKNWLTDKSTGLSKEDFSSLFHNRKEYYFIAFPS